MRDLPARRLASTVLCAAVLVGITGPAVAAADTARHQGRVPAPVPAAAKEKLLAQARALGDTNPVLSPVVELLDQSLQKGKLPADRARQLGEAAKEAVARAAADPKPATPTATAAPTTTAKPATPTATAAPTTTANPATPTATAAPTTTAKPAKPTATAKPAAEVSPTAPATAKPAAPTGTAAPTATAKPATPTASAAPAAPTASGVPASPAAPASSAAPAALTAPVAARHANVGVPSSRDLLGDALSAVQTAIDNLVKAVTDGLDQLLSSADDVVSGLVDLLTSVLGGGLPTNTLAELPSPAALPSLPTTG
ncbi:hypothetical protein ACH5A3_04015 [Streptomyces echinatus]|uniref:hypothetical protein n=1 Tax=Streptomyces echinatus TaxID=67293 RepID=UPI0037916EB7